MSRITGKNGEVHISFSDGISLANQALVKQASKTIQGTAYTRFYETSPSSMWNKSKVPTVRLQGFVGEVSAVPGTTVNTIVLSTHKLYSDNSSVTPTLTYTSTQTVTLTRHAADKQWHMISVDNDTGTAAVTTGTLITGASSFNDNWATAGGPAFVTAGDTLALAVKLTPGTAALTLAADIVYKLTAGTLLQERTEIPTFTVFPVEGGVLPNANLLACHESSATRTFYASFYDQEALIAKLGDTEGWTLGGTSDTIELEAQGDFAAESDFSGPIKGEGSFDRFFVADDLVWKTAMQRRTAIIRLVPNSAVPSQYYEFAAVIKDWGTENKVGTGMVEKISFTIDGNVEFRGV